MEKLYHANINDKNAGGSKLMLDKVEFKANKISRTKEDICQ